MRYEQLQAAQEETAVEARRGLSDQELFREFFQQVHGEAMSVQEETILRETLEALERERRNA